jgi:hypothetical protein
MVRGVPSGGGLTPLISDQVAPQSGARGNFEEESKNNFS